ncbi:MAG: hypothetical protein CMM94_02620 [Rickettsiales bacterium]|nr:hypothetical protein [Rickettsiales bacterium]|tara:strand:- start:1074 stop:1265 length:192 start_codon:yes stop_codon:yes gene_type:complete
MSLVAHVHSLESKHAKLERNIASESGRPMPDFTSITAMKKQKLLIKEELERLWRQKKSADDAA